MEMAEELRKDFNFLIYDETGKPFTDEFPERFMKLNGVISTNQFGKLELWHMHLHNAMLIRHVESGAWIVPTTVSTLKLIQTLAAAAGIRAPSCVYDVKTDKTVQLIDA